MRDVASNGFDNQWCLVKGSTMGIEFFHDLADPESTDHYSKSHNIT